MQSWDGILAKELDSKETTFGTRHVVNASGDEYGVLVLTNQHLLWIEREPIPDDAYRLSLTINLEDVDDVSLTGESRFIAIIESHGPHLFRLYVPLVTEQKISDIDTGGRLSDFIEEKDFTAFKFTLTKYVNQRKQSIEAAKRAESVRVVLDFSFLKDYMEKGGLILQRIACTNCGGRMKLPETGNTTECPYCHTTYRVEDVFERVKQLMGENP